MNDEENKFPPALLFRSFLLVAGSYMLSVLLVGTAAILVLMAAFPESFAILNSEPDEFEKIFEQNPEQIYPREFLWILLGISSLIYIALGYLVARLAPIARFPHAILLATILFVQYLQLAIGATGTIQRMFVLFMAAAPITAIVGANLFLRRLAKRAPVEP